MSSHPPLPFIDLQAQQARLREGIEAAVARVLAHGRYILGPEVTELEQRLAAFTGAPHVVTCGNGTDALVLVLMAAGIGPGDAVFVPAFTFAATAEAVALVGATPWLVDVMPDSFNINPDAVADAVAACRAEAILRPRGIIAVDLFGQPADYVRLVPLAREEGLILIADAAQSLGAAQDGHRVGTLADYTTTSFFPAKPLGCYGDGGAVLLADAEQAALLRSLRVHGQGDHKYDTRRVGLNSRLDTLQAAILLVKLEAFSGELQARDRIAARYAQGLSGLYALPTLSPGNSSSWAQYTIQLETGTRERIVSHCREAGVPTAIYYPVPLHRSTAYAACPWSRQGLPVAEALSEHVLSVPLFPDLDSERQDRIIAVLAQARKQQGSTKVH